MSEIHVKKSVKLWVGGLIIAGLFFGIHYGIIPVPAIGILKAVVPQKANLPDISDAKIADVKPEVFPSSIPNGCQDPIRAENWAWNANMGWNYSNGGIDTTKGSIAEKYGVCEHIGRQDDNAQMQNDLLACAKDLKEPHSTECSNGVQFITIMGDGAGAFLATLNAQAKKLCADCTAEIVGTTGFSRGEDKLMGPPSWKNPHSMVGDGLIAGVLRDGDWNTAQKYIGDNGLKNNPDEKTFDPDAVNWVNAGDYVKAAEMYVAGYCEDRKVIKNGKLTGETVNVCVKGVVTWTPADVTAAEKGGGLQNIVSTEQYRSQMPSALIGIKKWNKTHSDKLAALLAAALEAGDQIRAYPKALTIAADISAKIYGEQNGAYWEKYYTGTTEQVCSKHLEDGACRASKMAVKLGGSYADNMHDALAEFGVDPGMPSNNNFKATYTIFAKIVDQQYHPLFEKTPIPEFKDIATAAYLLQAKSLMDDPGSAAVKPQYSADEQPTEQFGDVNKNIEFNTGSAVLTPQGLATVAGMKDDLAITKGYITLDGNTDNTGNADTNTKLSLARAEAVKLAIQKMAPGDFPSERFRVNGYGPSKPVADNSTNEGRAKNRRVEVILAN